MIPSGAQEFLWTLKHGIWGVGTLSWVFGISDRTLAVLMDGYLSAIDIVQLATAAFFFVSWLFLKPVRFVVASSVENTTTSEENPN
ncbi:MAG: hypothetical protein ACFB16_27150 [Phormidesmis sp.]